MYRNRLKRRPSAIILHNSQQLCSSNKENPASKPLTTIGENSSMKIQKRSNVPTIAVSAPETDIFSQDNFSSSQEPTQGYLSQRSNICGTQSRSTQRYPKSYFDMALMKSGVDFEKKEIFLSSCDHALFVASFRNILLTHPEYPDNIKTFKQGLIDALSSDVTALKLLSGFNIIGQETSYLSQDSMIVNFLMVDFLQDVVIELLLDKIEKCSKFDDTLTEDIPLLPLILTHLKYVTETSGDQLFKKITNIFQNATAWAKREIISNAEFCLHQNKHDEFVSFLMEHICDGKKLFNLSTVKAFTNLCLTLRSTTHLRKKMNAYIQSGCKMEVMPSLVKFLLKTVNDDDDDSLEELILDLRPSLIWKNVETEKDTINKSQNEVFHNITQALTRSQKFFEIWHKTIQRLSGDEFNCLDFMILLILTTIREDKSPLIENIIRKRIKAGHINTKLLLSTKTQYPFILEQQTLIFLEILYEFLQDKCISIVNFARTAYRIMFGASESCQKKILKNLVELTCDRSIANKANNTSIALNVLRELSKHFTTEVQNWGLLLQPLLDRINEMNLQQSRIVMELLCSIAYPVPPIPDCPVLQDQIKKLRSKLFIDFQ